jgi:hypothetical protein
MPYFFPGTTQHPLMFLAFFCPIGVTMIFSKKIQHFSTVGKILYWVTVNITKPKNRYNHIIWESFFVCFSIIYSIFGDKSIKDEIEFFNELHNSPEFWISGIVIILLNVLVGIYTAKKYKNDKI